MLEEEKVGAEIQAQVAELKREDALAEKCRVEEQVEAKCREFGDLASWPVQLEEQVRAYYQQLQEPGRGRLLCWPRCTGPCTDACLA